MEAIQNAVSELLVNLALGIISLAAAYGVYYIRLGAVKLKAQTAQMADETDRKVLEDALSDVERLAALAVNYTEQTMAKELREKVKDGKADREALLKLGKKVFAKVKGEIAPAAQKVITDNLGSFDHYLEQCIEDAVLKVKQNAPYLTLPESVLVSESVAQDTGKDAAATQ